MKFNLNLSDINYIKLVFQDRQEKEHCLKASIKWLGEREIYACTKYEDELFIRTPQEIKLSFVSNNGLYTTNTTLKHTERNDSHIFFTLKTPEETEYRQSREYFRVKLEEAVIIYYQNGDSLTRLTCKTHDISANGVQVQFYEDVYIPGIVDMTILFEKRTIKTQAKLVRIDKEEKINKAAFSYLNISE